MQQQVMASLEVSDEKEGRQASKKPLATAQTLLPSIQTRMCSSTSSTIEVMTQQGAQTLSVISQEKNKSEKAREVVAYPGGREAHSQHYHLLAIALGFKVPRIQCRTSLRCVNARQRNHHYPKVSLSSNLIQAINLNEGD